MSIKIDNVRFPNGVRFRKAESFENDTIVIFCENCERVGFRWNYSYTRLMSVSGQERKEEVLGALYKHAELHNSLCQRFENMIKDNRPIYHIHYQDGVYTVDNSDMTYTEIDDKPKPKSRRMIRPEK